MGGTHTKTCPTRADLEYLTQQTIYDKETIQAWYGVFNKQAKNGRLSIRQFVTLFRSFFPGRNSDQFCEHVFRTFNTSNSGELSFREFLIAIHVTAQGSQEEKLRWTFRLYDVNGDGILTFEEVCEVLEASTDLRGEDRYRKKTQKITEEIFINMENDGLGGLTEEQFVENCLQFGEEV